MAPLQRRRNHCGARCTDGAHRPQRAGGTGGARLGRGASLIEALIGVLVIAAGLLGTAQWQVRLRDATDLARQRGEALQRASQALDRLRGGATPGSAETPAAAGGDTGLTLTVTTGPTPWGQARGTTARVDWSDRHGTEHHLQLQHLDLPEDPALVLALIRPTTGLDAGRVLGRHAAIPRAAVALHDGTSILRPGAANDTAAWRFDDRSGRVVAHCDVAPSRPLATLAPNDLRDCRPIDAVLLSGRVRRDTNVDPPTAVQVDRDDGGAPPTCFITPSTDDPDNPHHRYLCAVVPVVTARAADDDRSSDASRQRWSGRLRLAMPASASATTTRVCRYSADTDGSGAIDRPAEHPAAWRAVSGALPEQNLLIVHGRDCPAGAAATTAQGLLPWSHLNPATVPQAH